MAQTEVRADLKYTNEHEWVRLEGGVAVVGITAFAASQLGDITYLDLPEPGRKLSQMGELGVVESVKAAADLFSPLTGVVAEANTALADDPGLVNRDCYGQGWLVKVKDFEAAGLDRLMDAKAYEAFVGGL